MAVSPLSGPASLKATVQGTPPTAPELPSCSLADPASSGSRVPEPAWAAGCSGLPPQPGYHPSISGILVSLDLARFWLWYVGPRVPETLSEPGRWLPSQSHGDTTCWYQGVGAASLGSPLRDTCRQSWINPGLLLQPGRRGWGGTGAGGAPLPHWGSSGFSEERFARGCPGGGGGRCCRRPPEGLGSRAARVSSTPEMLPSFGGRRGGRVIFML